MSNTFDDTINRLLDRLPDDVDKREGGVLYTALAPVAMEMVDLYDQLDAIKQNGYSDTAAGEYLELRTKERGIERKAATYAVRKGTFNQEVDTGIRFGIEGVTYAVTARIGDSGYDYKITCEQAGTIGNTYTGDLLPLQYVAGLTSAVMSDVLVAGEDIETDAALRDRYDDTLTAESFGGNRAEYIAKTNAIDGVGGTKVYRAWDGGGTVKLVIISSEFKKPSTTLVELVQTTIDPTTNSGDGMGLAPIDHQVTVVACSETTINIATNLTLQTGWEWSDVKDYAEAAVDGYFTELAGDWADESALIVRISRIEMALLNCPGVVDVADTQINSETSNVVLAADNIPVRGTINAT